MAFLDFIKNRNVSQQQPVAQPSQAPAPTVESLPQHVKAQAVEAARPAVQTAPEPAKAMPEPRPSQPTPARGRGLSMER